MVCDGNRIRLKTDSMRPSAKKAAEVHTANLARHFVHVVGSVPSSDPARRGRARHQEPLHRVDGSHAFSVDSRMPCDTLPSSRLPYFFSWRAPSPTRALWTSPSWPLLTLTTRMSRNTSKRCLNRSVGGSDTRDWRPTSDVMVTAGSAGRWADWSATLGRGLPLIRTHAIRVLNGNGRTARCFPPTPNGAPSDGDKALSGGWSGESGLELVLFDRTNAAEGVRRRSRGRTPVRRAGRLPELKAPTGGPLSKRRLRSEGALALVQHPGARHPLPDAVRRCHGAVGRHGSELLRRACQIAHATGWKDPEGSTLKSLMQTVLQQAPERGHVGDFLNLARLSD